MKFLLDAHLPPGLKRVFATAGHDAIHTMDLPMHNASKDGVLNAVSMSEQRVVVSKDTDFYYSHLLHGRPWKLVLIRSGNMSLPDTRRMFEQHLNDIVNALQTFTLVELDRSQVSGIA
jgi:predicted nuclease of predicted toxin-antitoxin system